MEEVTLEKIDIIRKRTNLNYGDAKLALENNNGNVVDTLIYLENNKKTFTDNVSDVGNDLLNTVKEIIKKGNVNRIKIKKDNKALVDIPVNAGIAVGAITLFSPVILAIGAVTAIASKITIEVERPDGSIEVINDIVKNSFDQTVEKAKDFVQEMNMHKTNTTDNTTNNTADNSTDNTTDENMENNTEDDK
jgi:gas vesicle protein